MICYNVIAGTASPYLFDLLELYIPSRALCSSVDTCIFVLRTDVKDSKDNAPFLLPLLLSGTISLSLCDMLKLCLPSDLS